jgi:MoaA/NifB/PqqE/SkfB family radical SAM enzyme
VNGGRLDFLWLELTNRCNLQCVHCYTESHPGSGDRDVLTTAQYESVMRQAYALGCRRLQFIGGEPQLHPDFLRLLGVAKETGFEFIEVFTNLMRLRDDTLRFAADAGIRFATSVYSDDPAVHNAITKVGSSHVIDPSCGPDSETCPQSGEPPGCPQSGEPPGCPQSPA